MVESSQQHASSKKASSAYITPVQFISQLLLDLKSRYFTEDSPESQRVRSHIDYSL